MIFVAGGEGINSTCCYLGVVADIRRALNCHRLVVVIIQRNFPAVIDNALMALLWQSVWTTQLVSNFVRHRFATDSTRMKVSSRSFFCQAEKHRVRDAVDDRVYRVQRRESSWHDTVRSVGKQFCCDRRLEPQVCRGEDQDPR